MSDITIKNELDQVFLVYDSFNKQDDNKNYYGTLKKLAEAKPSNTTTVKTIHSAVNTLILFDRQQKPLARFVSMFGKNSFEVSQANISAMEQAMKFVEDNQHTIQDLATLQVHLEQQLSEIKRATQEQLSPEEQVKMDDLNSKLIKSHRLIKKLRGDLSKSLDRLKQTRRKLYDQYESTEELQKENDTLKQQLEASKSMGGPSEQEVEQLVATFEKERQDMSKTIDEYKKQIAEQSQALQQ